MVMVKGQRAPGEQLWVKRYPLPAAIPTISAPRSLGASPDGTRVFVTGRSNGDYATIAYDASSGAQLWAERYKGPGNGAFSLGVSPDGTRVFVTGESFELGDVIATIAYDASSGTQLWVARYSGPGNGADRGVSLGVSPDGTRVFVTGLSQRQGPASDYDFATIAYDASSGAQLWVARYNGPANGDDLGRSLGVSPDGTTVFVTGGSYGDYATIAYDASTGNLLWEETYNGPGNGNDFALSLGVSPDGSKVLVTGTSEGLESWIDYATVAYDASSGDMQWVARFNGPENQRDEGSWLGVSPDGSKVFVTGSSSNVTFDEVDYATVAYDASSGTQVWVKRYTGPNAGSAKRASHATSLAVNPDGSSVYVTGASQGSGGTSDYATIAYDASTGDTQWLARYNGPGNSTDLAYSMGVSPDGSKVFVTGESAGLRGRDYATIAYSTR